MLEVRKLLADYFAKNSTIGIDKFLSEVDSPEETIEKWKTEHMRTEYNK